MYIYLCINSRRPGKPGLACQLHVGFPQPSVPEQDFSGKGFQETGFCYWLDVFSITEQTMLKHE